MAIACSYYLEEVPTEDLPRRFLESFAAILTHSSYTPALDAAARRVAVYGQGHYAVSKTESKGRTFTRIEQVSDGDRAEEVARMLGGKDLTTVALDHAREMLAGAGRT